MPPLLCCNNCVSVCFFFKQKTAYEMRISDWSSDVCSSDLMDRTGKAQALVVKFLEQRQILAQRIAVLHRLEGDQLALLVQPHRVGCGQIGRAWCRERVCPYV